MWLEDEVELLRPVFDAAGERFHLIGHSFGGAVALKAALLHSARMRSLVLYEPVLFSVLLRDAPQSAAAQEILAVRDDSLELMHQGNLAAAAQRFVDYWMGKGAWAALPQPRRDALAASVRSVGPEWHAAFNEPTPLEALRAIDVPVLLLTGSASTAAAGAAARLVGRVLPRARVQQIEGVGHMAPLTHPERVNPLIEQFLELQT